MHSVIRMNDPTGLRVTIGEGHPQRVGDQGCGLTRIDRPVCADAATDSWQLTDRPEIDAVISGLPLLSMSAGAVTDVVATAVSVLRPQGRFYQLTYGPTCPVRPNLLTALRLRATRIGWTPRNLPPASAYRIERQSEVTTLGGAPDKVRRANVTVWMSSCSLALLMLMKKH